MFWESSQWLLVHGGLLEDFMEEKGIELVLGPWVGFGWVERTVTVLLFQVLTVCRLWDKGFKAEFSLNPPQIQTNTHVIVLILKTNVRKFN